jgi:hypothetical protein
MRASKEDGESGEDVEKVAGLVREVYERAVLQVLPGDVKLYWRRYIFLCPLGVFFYLLVFLGRLTYNKHNVKSLGTDCCVILYCPWVC